MRRYFLRIHTEAQIAYHEAGHAVMAYVLGSPMDGLCVRKPGSGVDGNLEFTPHKVKRHDWIMILLAGAAGEALHARDTHFATRGVNDPRYKVFGATGDYKTAYAAMDAGYPGTPQEVDAKLNEFLRMVIAALSGAPVWAALDTLAQTLLERKKLSGAEIEIVLDHTPARAWRMVIERDGG